MTDEEFIALVRRNPAVATILDLMPKLGAPDAWLTAGCLAQTVWNLKAGRPPDEGIRDYDLFYRDPDLSWEAEDKVIRRAALLFGSIPVEIRNQARVHLWFGPKFGYDIPPLRSAREGIDRFLFRGICIGIDAVNCVAPTFLAYGLAPRVIAARGKMIAITSQMGSIADNGSGGWNAYRASKAALNAAWRSMAVEIAREPIAIAMLHPGWVKTDMGGGGAPLAISDSIRALRRVIEGLTPADKGVFLNHQGQALPW